MEQYHERETFTGLKLRDHTLRYEEFTECIFDNCDFDQLRLIGCKLIDCVFSKCSITNPVFDSCTVTSNDFIQCHLLGINWESLSAGFVSPLHRMESCQLKYNNFVGSSYPKFTFSGNDILESLFADCNLSRSQFTGCHLDQTEFFRCDLRGTSFDSADGYVIDLTNCKLKGAVFSFPEVVNLLNGLDIIIQ